MIPGIRKVSTTSLAPRAQMIRRFNDVRLPGDHLGEVAAGVQFAWDRRDTSLEQRSATPAAIDRRRGRFSSHQENIACGQVARVGAGFPFTFYRAQHGEESWLIPVVAFLSAADLPQHRGL